MKICFLIPFFGKMNNYFPLFLESCRRNRDIDWIIFTDDSTGYNYPENVKVHYTTFEAIKDLFQKKFSFSIKLNRPYKLCDFKPAYGYVFEDYLKDYDFWGYCDTDLIWGNIQKFITADILNNYDKIGVLGHCTLFRNTKDCNTAFMNKNVDSRYETVCTNDKGFSFDEEFNNSINNIYERMGKKIYSTLNIGNIYTKSNYFKLVRYDFEHNVYIKENRKNSFFLWDNGNLFRYTKTKGILLKEEFLYIHLQSRQMKWDGVYSEKFKIIPHCFEALEVPEVTASNFDNIRKFYYSMHYLRLRSKNLITKINRRIKNR